MNDKIVRVYENAANELTREEKKKAETVTSAYKNAVVNPKQN